MKTFVFVENAEITYHIHADSEKIAWEKISQLQLYNNLPDACIDVKECFLEEIIEKDKI
jgi:hypothetical protein